VCSGSQGEIETGTRYWHRTVEHAGRTGGTVTSMSTAATAERLAFADTLDEAGPDADTLCGGWNTRDLAAHVVMRERRPDGAAGVIIKPLAGYADKVQTKIAQTPWDELVGLVRSGPPKLSPMRLDVLDRVANTVEFFVHHEDVRRAGDGWTTRELDGELTDDLYSALKRMAKLLTRKAPAGMVLAPSGGQPPITANGSEPVVTLRGPVGELVLFVYGRQDHAQVELDGPAEAVAALRAASFGV
jgi:uncharacterized protein (TIGR03085 family)